MTVPRRYLAFDIETAAEIAGEEFDWRSHRPIGITCAAVWASDEAAPRLFHGRAANGLPAPRMSREDAAALVAHLEDEVARGGTVLTWNGLGFDFDVLAEESGAHDACRRLAVAHVDMMFHVVCAKGFPVGLDKAAQALGVTGKPEGMSGALAPQLWAQGQYQTVLDYVAQDVRIALDVAAACEDKRLFRWLTRKGTPSTMPLPRGWLSVRDALALPEPDVSWMSNPLTRASFTAWMGTPAAPEH